MIFFLKFQPGQQQTTTQSVIRRRPAIITTADILEQSMEEAKIEHGDGAIKSSSSPKTQLNSPGDQVVQDESKAAIVHFDGTTVEAQVRVSFLGVGIWNW